MRHAAVDNGFGYWLTLTRNRAVHYARLRRPVAGARAVLSTVLKGHYGERCDDCGRGYQVWWCQDAKLWQVVAEQPPLACLLCIACFDRRARRIGINLEWSPSPFDREAA